LGIAYSASIGGFTTLVGTPTNVTFLTIWRQSFPQGPEISAGQWMLAVAPLGALYLVCAWGCLTWGLPVIPGAENLEKDFFTRRLKQLGPPRRPEWLMLVVFVTTALLWMVRKPLTFGETTLLTGWQSWRVLSWIGSTGLHDSTVAMGMAILMFIIPARKNEHGRTERLMDWRTAERLPWGILLLIGGGFALAGAFQSTGLSLYLGQKFSTLVADWPAWLLVAAVCFLLTFLTELTSNVATVATLVPVLAQAAVDIELDPRLVMIPATIAASCAFMLPIATPPNAIVFGSGRIEMWQMVRYGIVLNLLGVVLITAAMFLLIVPQLGISLDAIPDWARPPVVPAN
jgi:sodium-dependent dicarboxylate transporter 2/3/5